VTPGGGARNAAGVKRAFWDPQLAARIVVHDPCVLAATPPMVLLTTGVNALAHCVEGIYSRMANPLSTALAIGAAPLLARGLRAVAAGHPNESDLAALGEGASLAGMVLANARVGIAHAICHVLGARFGVPHGVANSIMLPPSLAFNLPATRAEQKIFADALGCDVEELRNEIGVPSRLRDVGVQRSVLPEAARDVMYERGLHFNPRRVSGPEEVHEILLAAW
jgi:alcohol dehydrogenase class IV